MSLYKRFLLVFMAAAFVGGTAISLFFLYGREMMPATSAESKALENLPKSILHYPSPGEVREPGPERAVICHLDEKYEALIAERKEKDGAALVATAKMGTDDLEIYAAPSGTFFAIVKGPDAAGHMEACEVAAGEGWTLSPARQSP